MKIARYFVVGGVSAVVDFVLFGVLILAFGSAHWFAAAATSFVAATGFNYLLSIRMVFSAGVRFGRRHEVMLVFLASLVGLALNQFALWIFYEIGGWNIWLAKGIATGTAFLWNFTARNSYIFSERK